jgi:glycerophosphoryl diester phosphodiesterase
LKKRRLPGSPSAKGGGPMVLAHRGWSKKYPENTVLAFEKAAALPVDGLEMDIRSTADGVPVVIHDERVDRTTNGSGRVNDLTLEDLKRLDAGYRWSPDGGRSFPFRGQGLTVPTLAEVFSSFPDLWINLDIKQKNPPMVHAFARMIRDFHLIDHVCVGSFDTPTIRAFRRACSEAATAASVREVIRLLVLSKVFLVRLYRGKGRVLQIPEYYRGRRILDRRLVRAAHRKGLAVHVWTVNERRDMRRLLEIGVDGLITDYPDRLIDLLEGFHLDSRIRPTRAKTATAMPNPK